MSDFGLSDKTVTSVGCAFNDIGLSNNDPMAEQSTMTVRVRRSGVLVRLADVEMLPSEQLTAQEKFSQRSRYHSSQPAQTQLNDLFELTRPTVLDPRHATQLEC